MNPYPVEELIHYCNVTFPKSSRINAYVIDYYDLTFVLSGRLIYYADKTRYILNKNDAIFLSPGTLRFREALAEPVHYVSFNFRAAQDATFSFEPFMPGSITAGIRKLLDFYPGNHLSQFCYSQEKCTNMLNCILFELLNFNVVKSSNEHIIRIQNYVEEHITEQITLQAVSTCCSLSREYTSYIFKKETGKTLTAYVHERKLQLAKELILKNEMSLTDIAEYLGFENYNYFSRLFRKYMDTTPVSLKKHSCISKVMQDYPQ